MVTRPSAARPATRLTLREAATVLGLSEVWVRRLVAAGRIAAGRDGRRIVIERSAIDAYRERAARRARPRQPVPPEDDWAWEGNVVVALVAHLEADGWRVVERANPASREHGVDLVVERDGVRRAMEVKGFPSALYIRGSKIGQRKRWRSTQARSYMGDLLLATLLLLATRPDHEVAMAVPARPTFVTLVERLTGSLSRLGIGAYVVYEGGRVDEVLRPARRQMVSRRTGANR